jgi:hypothetical protein
VTPASKPRSESRRWCRRASRAFPNPTRTRSQATRRSERRPQPSRNQTLGLIEVQCAAAEWLQAAYAIFLIRKSSIRLPDFNFARSQRGVLPRPAHVSDGRSGFRNFGTTVGYERRPVDDFVRSASTTPLSCFRRSSRRRFSASRVVASLAATSSWSAHSSSVDIDLKSFRFTTVPNHDSMVVIVGCIT